MLTVDKTKGQIYVNRDSENDKITGGRNFMRPSTRGDKHHAIIHCPCFFMHVPFVFMRLVDQKRGHSYVHGDEIR